MPWQPAAQKPPHAEEQPDRTVSRSIEGAMGRLPDLDTPSPFETPASRAPKGEGACYEILDFSTGAIY